MTSWADSEFMLEHAREALAERFPGAVVEILETFDIAWSGWEFDHEGALISLDGEPRLVVINQTGNDDRLEQQIIDRMPEYRRLLGDTARVLSSLWYRRADRGDLRELPKDEDRLLTEVYRRVGYVEQMGARGRRHVAEALRTASEEATQFPEEIEHSRQTFEALERELAPLAAYWRASQDLAADMGGAGDWTAEDERLAAHSRVADIIDTMTTEQLGRVLMAARAIRAPSTEEVMELLKDFGTEPAQPGDEIKGDDDEPDETS